MISGWFEVLCTGPEERKQASDILNIALNICIYINLFVDIFEYQYFWWYITLIITYNYFNYYVFQTKVLCRGPEEQKQALDILNIDLKCEAFVLTVPASFPSPERPIMHPYRWVKRSFLQYLYLILGLVYF